MLVYVRQDQASKLLKPIAEDDVPHGLIEEIEKNKKMDEERVNSWKSNLLKTIFIREKKEKIFSRFISLHLNYLKIWELQD